MRSSHRKRISSYPLAPFADNTGSVGAANRRWANVYCVAIQTGDIEMKRGKAHWVIEEEENGLYATNKVTNRRYRIKLEPA